MTPKFWQKKTFKDLRRKWEEELRLSGFDDAEKLINGQLVLKQRAANCYRNLNETARAAKQRYYELLGIYANEEKFSDDIERFVMVERSRGVKIKDISSILRAAKQRYHRDTIRLIIRKYEAKWKIKK